MNPQRAPILVRHKQTTRMLKVSCDCGYTVRVARSWLLRGAPICPTCKQAMKERH